MYIATSGFFHTSVACHFPFVRQSAYIRSQAADGKNAGTLWDGEQALGRLVSLAGTTLVFTGHQHFHHIEKVVEEFQRMSCELQRQRAKILDAIAGLDADVVGLIEMENTPGVEPAADLVAGLNDLLGPNTYDFVDTGVIGTDAIRVGFLYQPDTVIFIRSSANTMRTFIDDGQ